MVILRGLETFKMVFGKPSNDLQKAIKLAQKPAQNPTWLQRVQAWSSAETLLVGPSTLRCLSGSGEVDTGHMVHAVLYDSQFGG